MLPFRSKGDRRKKKRVSSELSLSLSLLINTHFLFSRYWSTMRSSVSWFTMLEWKKRNKTKRERKTERFFSCDSKTPNEKNRREKCEVVTFSSFENRNHTPSRWPRPPPRASRRASSTSGRLSRPSTSNSSCSSAVRRRRSAGITVERNRKKLACDSLFAHHLLHLLLHPPTSTQQQARPPPSARWRAAPPSTSRPPPPASPTPPPASRSP